MTNLEVLEEIRKIAHTFCMDYPMPPGTKLWEISTEDCLDAIWWKLNQNDKLISELQDKIK